MRARMRDRLTRLEALGFPDRWDEDPTLRARALACFYVLGALIAALSVAFSGWVGSGQRLVAIAEIVLGVATAILIWRHAARVPSWLIQALVAASTVMVTVGIHLGREVANDAEMLYVLVGLYAAAFLPRRPAFAQVGFIALCYGLTLGLRDHLGGEDQQWAATVASLLVLVLLVSEMRLLLGRRIAAHRRAQGELESAASLLRATLESTADGIVVVDREGRMVSLNRKFLEMWRIPDEIAESRDDDRAIEFVLDQLAEPERFVAKIEELYATPDASSYDVLHFKDGRVFERYSQAQRLGDEIVGRVWSFRDVTERHRSQERLRHLADFDPITGLVNRRRFEEELAHHALAAESGAAVLLLDLDEFKHVNDTLGHRTGDEVLRSVAELLRGESADHELLARLGGDEFALMVDGRDASAEERAARLLDAVRAHRVISRGHPVRITTSIGAAIVDGHGPVTGEELMVRADKAMYSAKGAGRDRCVVWTPELGTGDHPALNGRSLNRIQRAIAEDRFLLYAQPIVDTGTGSVHKHELLLRMAAEDGAVLPPGAFLSTAERFELLPEIDRWVSRTAIGLIADEAAAGRNVTLAVNLSGQSIADPELPVMIEREIEAARVDPDSLVFEVTETSAVTSTRHAGRVLKALRDMGCRCALDDFGAGFGSFYYLKHLPVDYLKIDGDFIRDLPHSPTDQTVVKTMVRLSRQLGKATIAEYVGDETTLRLLERYGVDYAQGFYIGMPRPACEILGSEAVTQAHAGEKISPLKT